jgi:integrase
MGVRVREKPRGSGVYWVFINHQGRRKSKQVGDKKLAEKVAKGIEAKLVLGQFDLDPNGKPKVPTFSEYAIPTQP